MARPKLPFNSRKSIIISIRVSPKEEKVAKKVIKSALKSYRLKEKINQSFKRKNGK